MENAHMKKEHFRKLKRNKLRINYGVTPRPIIPIKDGSTYTDTSISM